MARVSLSALVSNIKGKLNGSVFQGSQGGLTLRTQQGKNNIQSQSSNLQRNGLTLVQLGWQNLTDAQRLVWNNYALFIAKYQKNSVSRYVNGHQIFIQVNALRFALKNTTPLFNDWLLTAPTFTVLPNSLRVQQFCTSPPDFKVFFDAPIYETYQTFALFLSAPLLGSQVSRHYKQALIKVAPVFGSEQNITAEYKAIYGRIPLDQEYVNGKVCIWDENNLAFSSYYEFREKVYDSCP